MSSDFKENIIRLRQHPIMHNPIIGLTNSDKACAYDLIFNLIDSSWDDSYTLVDNFQMARLYYALGKLDCAMGGDAERIINNLLSSLHCLQKSGIDLSLNKWAELVSVRIEEE